MVVFAALSSYLNAIFDVRREIIQGDIIAVNGHKFWRVGSYPIVINYPFRLFSAWCPCNICGSECYHLFRHAKVGDHLARSRILFVCAHVDDSSSETFIARKVVSLFRSKFVVTSVDTIGIFHELELTFIRIDESHIVKRDVVTSVGGFQNDIRSE